ncbi:MAG: hypothetical protein QOK29_3938 [Rhodospirillaceae bacterium]|jgi:3-oxoadipate enol-lactonase|nr:hypothetical protein [Rhodospirillaceae bacterium]
MPRLETQDASLFYLQRGAGPDIVWLPGGDNLASDWEDQFKTFDRDYRNTSFDPRGVGQTVSHREPPWSIADFATDCANLIRAVCRPPVFVVGLSMGSLMALQLAVDYPELVRAAIPMGTTARPTGFVRDWMVAEVEFRRAGGRISRDFAVHHYAAFMYPSEVLGDDRLWAKVKPLVERSYGEREGEFLAAQWQACIDFDVVDRLPHCEVPIHVIAFSQDMQTPARHGKRVAELAARGQFHLLEGLGHVSMAGHRPDAVNNCIRQILEANA